MNESEALKFAAKVLRVDETMHYEGKPHDEAIALLDRLSENAEARTFYGGTPVEDGLYIVQKDQQGLEYQQTYNGPGSYKTRFREDDGSWGLWSTYVWDRAARDRASH